jgi:hypothetical protein
MVTTESRRVVELLYLRDRTLRKLRQSADLTEVWHLYQDLKVLSLHIDLVQKTARAAALECAST